ncbi:MAG TPA: ATP-binding protein [Solirubrobacterales bacterium]|nr:ATP-binding protein [Solirubrobacterales bacterium]
MARELSLDLEPEAGASGQARAEIRAAFGDSLPTALLHDLTVVVSELVSNSVEHGPGETIQVRLRIANDGSIFGEVEDKGDGRVAIRDMADDPNDALGLRIVDWLTDRWAVYEGSTHVWFEMGLGNPEEKDFSEPVDPV